MGSSWPRPKALEKIERDSLPGLVEMLSEEGIEGVLNRLSVGSLAR